MSNNHDLGFNPLVVIFFLIFVRAIFLSLLFLFGIHFQTPYSQRKSLKLHVWTIGKSINLNIFNIYTVFSLRVTHLFKWLFTPSENVSINIINAYQKTNFLKKKKRFRALISNVNI